MGAAALIALILAGVALVIGVVIYNRLIALRVEAESAWSDIDVQLKRRHDLVPNVVETVKGYAAHEREALEGVIAARSSAVGAAGASPAERAGPENMLTQTLGRLFALSESYPQLRAAEPFMELQRTLSAIEDSIQQARRYYNATVRELNTRIQQFPSNLVANAALIKPREFFEIDEPERQTPEVKF